MTNTGFRKAAPLLAFLLATSLAAVVYGQHARQSAPFQINLLPGYRLKETRGIDTRTGEISKPGGLVIHYDMEGDLSSGEERKIKPAQQWKRQCAWKKDEYPDPRADSADVQCWIDVDEDKHEKNLHVSFPDLTEFWTRVKDQREIDLALKMLLSYDPDHPAE